MKIIDPYYEILTPIALYGTIALEQIERVARTCYKSEDQITDQGESAKKLIKKLIDKGHEAMLEHSILSVKFVCDRGISHELVRHRLASFAQESTRYCNYSNDKFGKEITVIRPYFLAPNTRAYELWKSSMQKAEHDYFLLLEVGLSPQEARSVLPNSLKTEVVMTANYREWRHFLKLRCDAPAHPQMKELTISLAKELKKRIPVIFDDILAKE